MNLECGDMPGREMIHGDNVLAGHQFDDRVKDGLLGLAPMRRPVAGSCNSRRRLHRRRHGKSGLNKDHRDMLNPSSYTTFDNIAQ